MCKKIFQSGIFSVILTLTICPGMHNARAETNLEFFLNKPPEYQDVRVKKVLSVDTVILENGKKIRLIGLKAPEITRRLKTPSEQTEKIGLVQIKVPKPVSAENSVEEKALHFVQKLLEGQRVRLEFDELKKDAENNSLAYVFLLKGNTFVNADILKNGYANLSISPPNTKYEKELRQAYKQASKEQRGFQGQY